MKIRFTVIITALLLAIWFSACSSTRPDDSGKTMPSAVIPASSSESAPAESTLCGASLDTESQGLSEDPATVSPSAATPSSQMTSPPQDTLASPSNETVSAVQEPDDDDFVLVKDYISTISVDLKYATDDNFTGQVIYNFSDAYLRYGTVKKLAAAQDKLSEQGFSLKIWDAFRPVEAQFKLWEVCPDANYVADPNKGYSSHSKGNTVDVTLVKADGTEVTMPTGFDNFSALADRDYSDVDNEAAANAMTLEKIMADSGFKPYSKEWWHFSDTTSYPVEESFTP